MDKNVHGLKLALSGAQAPRILRWCILALEVLLLGLIAFQVVMMAIRYFMPAPTHRALASVTAQNDGRLAAVDLSQLYSFDPFFREIASEGIADDARAPESSLKIELFGLRAIGDGKGSAILKMQDSEQKLVRVGEPVATGITLVGVYKDRLEISRAGVREAVYLRPQGERESAATHMPTKPTKNTNKKVSSDHGMLGVFGQLKLEPVRRDRRIIGFRLPEDTPFMLKAVGFEAGDILLEANGAPLTSFERISEIADDLAGASSVNITIERRGETRSLSLGL